MAERKAIFITGGGSGIGRAVARYFAAKGWRIGIADVDANGLVGTRVGIPDGLLHDYVMDVRDRRGWTATLATFTEAAGRLDVLFNNAGIAVSGPFAETSFEDIDRLIAINFTGVVNGAHCGYPFLKGTPGSCLLNTCSAAGLWGVPNGAIYSAAKFGVRGLTESLDAEWAPVGIRVRSLMPSFIETPLLNGQRLGSNQTIREGVLARGLEITPVEEVAEAAWRAVHGNELHTVVGKTAKRLRFAARWMPGKLRNQTRGLGGR